MYVKDYMKTGSLTIAKDATLRDAVKQMVEKRSNTLIVLDDEQQRKPVGMVTIGSIINAVVPDYLEDNPSISSFTQTGQLEEFAEKVKDLPVEKIMIDIEATLKKNDPMIKAATLTTINALRTVPVVDEEGHMVGTISRTCIKNAIYNDMFPDNDRDFFHDTKH